MLQYEVHPCARCGKPSVGLFMTVSETSKDGWLTEYYCNSHWHARKAVEDKEQDKREYEQFKDQKWYQEKFPERFADPFMSLDQRLRQKKQEHQIETKPQQLKLF